MRNDGAPFACSGATQYIRSGSTIATHCAKVKDIIKSSNCTQDPRFPLGVPGLTGSYRVLCHPICSDQVTFTANQCLAHAQCGKYYLQEDIEAVLEFIKKGKGEGFTEDDIEVVNSYLVWGAVGIHYANQYARVHHQKFVNDFLLSVVK